MAERKTIKNYTTAIKEEKTIMEIELLLAKHGAISTHKLYADGKITGIAFQSIINDKPLAFKLPMEADKIMEVFNQAVRRGDIPKKFLNDKDQARRTGWRIIKDWVDSQMSLIEINTVRFEQVFLPYMYDMTTNQTLFEKFEKRDFNMMIEDNR